MSERRAKGCLVAAIIWCVILATLGGAYRFLVHPHLKEKLAGETGGTSQYKDELTLAADFLALDALELADIVVRFRRADADPLEFHLWDATGGAPMGEPMTLDMITNTAQDLGRDTSVTKTRRRHHLQDSIHELEAHASIRQRGELFGGGYLVGLVGHFHAVPGFPCSKRTFQNPLPARDGPSLL